MKKAEKDAELIRLWRLRPRSERTSTDILIFYGSIQKERPYLFFGIKGDPYQQLKTVLRNEIVQ